MCMHMCMCMHMLCMHMCMHMCTCLPHAHLVEEIAEVALELRVGGEDAPGTLSVSSKQ